jgi:lipoprotein YgeR
LHIKIIFLVIIFYLCLNLYSNNTYTVKKGDTLYSISKKNNLTVEQLIQNNNIKDITSIPVGTILNLSKLSDNTHIVIKGDTLFSISRKYNIPLLKIMEYNYFEEGQLLKLGQEIKLIGNPIIRDNSDNEKIIVENPFLPVQGLVERYSGRISGIQITTKEQQEIKSISSGKVVWYDSYKGIGKVVLISGDNGFDYLYGTTDPLDIRIGTQVQKGEIIGKLKDSNKLIFSVFKNGKPIKYSEIGLDLSL